MDTLPDTPTPAVSLRVVRFVAPLLALAMGAVVVIGLVTAQDGAVAELAANAWGRATVVDLYLALGAAWIWIVWRERRLGPALLWALLLVVGGSVALWGYVAWRAQSARDIPELLLGQTEIGTPETRRGPTPR